MTLHEHAIEFIRGSLWIEPLEAARELVNLSKHGCDWPKAPMGVWLATISALVDSGQLQRREDGCVYIAVEKPAAVQMGLFD